MTATAALREEHRLLFHGALHERLILKLSLPIHHVATMDGQPQRLGSHAVIVGHARPPARARPAVGPKEGRSPTLVRGLKTRTLEMSTQSEKRCLLLLVDDETRSARVLAKMLREDGYEVELAFDGAAAIARLARSPVPDVLLTDFRLAHADGVAVAEYARSRRATMPILMLTGYPEIAARLIDDLDPAPVILPKPLAYADVMRELERALATVSIPVNDTGPTE